MIADLDAVAGADVLRQIEELVVHEGAVGGAKVLDDPTTAGVEDPGVEFGHASIVDHDTTARSTTDRRLRFEVEHCAGQGLGGENNQSTTRRAATIDAPSTAGGGCRGFRRRSRNGSRCGDPDPTLLRLNPHRPRDMKKVR